jgi:hypothetical protein
VTDLATPPPPASPAGAAGAKVGDGRSASGWAFGATVLGFWLAFNVLVTVFVRAERTFYSWDEVSYWALATALADDLGRDALKAIGTVLRSVRFDDYNLLAALPLALLHVVFGKSRLVFVLGVTNLYALPALVTLLCLFRRLALRSGKIAPVMWPVAALLCGLHPLLWEPVLRGKVDVGGGLLLALAFHVYLKRPFRELSYERLAAVGALLAGLVLFRRWLTHAAAGFCVVVAADAAVAWWRARSRGREGWAILARLAVLGGVLLAVLVVVSWPLPRRLLATDYRSLYAAYAPKGGFWLSVAESFKWFLHPFGFMHFFALLAGVVWGLRHDDRRRATLVIGLQLLVTVLLRSRVQPLSDERDFYLVMTALLVLPLLMLNGWLTAESRRGPRVGEVLTTFLVLWSAGTFLLAFAIVRPPPPSRWPKRAWNLRAVPFGTIGQRFVPLVAEWLGHLRVKPLAHRDVVEVERLLDTLPRLLGDPADTAYVLASGEKLNSHLVRHAALSRGRVFPAIGRIEKTADVDLRDGFPAGLLRARLVVVTTPVLLHLRREDQQVVAVPAEQILAGRGLGAAYERLPETFRLDGGVTVFLYRRTRPLGEAEIESLSRELQRAYPTKPFVYQPPG